MGQDVCLITSSSQNNRFLNYVMSSKIMKYQLEMIAIGSTFKRINVADIRNLLVPIPPLEEQNTISSYLDEQVHQNDSCIKGIESGIQRIYEYKSKLIADVVTGKLDVREAAAHLSEEIEPLEEGEVSPEDLDEQDDLEPAAEEDA
jgi:type I restriction enzyme S subunit